jgi:hypothetical protein
MDILGAALSNLLLIGAVSAGLCALLGDVNPEFVPTELLCGSRQATRRMPKMSVENLTLPQLASPSFSETTNWAS